MVLISSSRYKQLTSSLVTKQALLDKANEALSSALTEVESYRLDTGEGSQSVTYRKIEELTKTIAALEAQIESITKKLYGTGLISFNLRRKS
jgi:multidrug resistance efflux pump